MAQVIVALKTLGALLCLVSGWLFLNYEHLRATTPEFEEHQVLDASSD